MVLEREISQLIDGVDKLLDRVEILLKKAMETDDLEKSIDYLDEALELVPSSGFYPSLIWGMKACAFMDAGAPPIIAINCLKRAITLDPTLGKNYEILGKIYLELDEPEIAIRYFNQGRMFSEF